MSNVYRQIEDKITSLNEVIFDIRDATSSAADAAKTGGTSKVRTKEALVKKWAGMADSKLQEIRKMFPGGLDDHGLSDAVSYARGQIPLVLRDLETALDEEYESVKQASYANLSNRARRLDEAWRAFQTAAYREIDALELGDGEES